MAFDYFRKVPLDDTIMDNLYNLALDFERKRQFNKAEAAFRYMADYNPKFRDLETRLSRARQMSETLILGGGQTHPGGTLVLRGGAEKPMLGRYRVEKELGKGAMGVVYLGKDPKIGRVVAINSDVILRPGARVEGQILVVGGDVDGKEGAFIGGDVRTYRQRLTYRQEGDRLIASGSSEEDARWWRRHQKWHSHSYSDLNLISARTYNRVEGLPILIGPSFGHRSGQTRFELEALGVFRTGDDLQWNSQTVGHNLKAELSYGRGASAAIGGKLFDVVDPVEQWQLSDVEVGLASFFLHRDFRDYYNRHGGSGYVRLALNRSVSLTGSLSDERWAVRETFDPFTLFRNGQDWRPNPEMDEGRFHVTNATLRVDTRSDEVDPRSGWDITADYEYGTGNTTAFGPTSPGVRNPSPGGATNYARAFLDLRRYNRMSPEAQLNLRVVAGGWLNGDELPLQRRFSVGGPGAIDGYPFRRTGDGDDVRQCSDGVNIPLGVPAQCDEWSCFRRSTAGTSGCRCSATGSSLIRGGTAGGAIARSGSCSPTPAAGGWWATGSVICSTQGTSFQGSRRSRRTSESVSTPD
jgi:hypothetical protein